ncbi:MAG: 8-oxoguanine deaminase [Anaerolineales bacterium]|jgi:cytosine/adenosine deaminase-related metal-dependent hydrolase
MTTMLVRHADVLVTMDADRREIRDGGMFIRDGWIEGVGASQDLPSTADETLDLGGRVVVPGLVNAHHHLYQTLTRAVPAAQDVDLFHWLKTLYPIWARLTPEAIRVSTQVGLAELALSGCTTASDHLYLFPNGARLDDEIEAASPVGLRFHACRGSMSLGESQGGLPPDRVIEKEEAILRDTQRLIEAYHDPRPGAMLRIVVAPCSPFSVTADLMREAAALARSAGARLHTHLAETLDEERFCLERFGLRPVDYAEQLTWLGDDVWFAHGVHVNREEAARLGRSGTGIAHCPSSNMRLASGIAPVREYLKCGVKLGLGVDGSASNDSSHLLAEARQAMLLARLSAAAQESPGPLLSARQALELATRGGAEVLGRSDIGQLASGRCADFAAFRLDRLDYAGALHDPVAALVFCSPAQADVSVVNGRFVVKEGRLATLDLGPLVERHNRIAAELCG